MEKPDVDSIEGICAGHRHPAEEQHPQPAVHGRHDDRDSRLPAAALRARRADDLPRCGKEVIRETAEVVADAPAARCPRARACSSASTCRVVASRADVAPSEPEPDDERRRRRADADRRGRAPGAAAGAADLVDPVAATLDALRRKGFGRLLSTAAPVDLRGRRHAARRCEDRDRASAGHRRSREGGRRHRASRLTDSIETAFTEGGGAAFAIELLPTRGGQPRDAPVQRALRVPRVQHAVRSPAAAAVLVQQPVRRVPDLPRLRQHHRARHGPRRARPAKSIQQNAIEPWTKPHYRAQLVELKRAAQEARPARRAVGASSTTTRSGSSSRATAASWEGVKGSSAGSSARNTRCTSACSSAAIAAT